MEILHSVKYQPAKVAGGYTDRILRVNLAPDRFTYRSCRQTSSRSTREAAAMPSN